MDRFDDLKKDIEALKRGDYTGCRSIRYSSAELPTFTSLEIREIRNAAHLPQWLFAGCLGVSLKTVEAWEGGRCRPAGAARRLLGLLKADPEFFRTTGFLVRTVSPWKPNGNKCFPVKACKE